MMIGFVSISFGFICLDIYVWVSVQFCLGLPGVLMPCKKRKKLAQMYVRMLTRVAGLGRLSAGAKWP